MILSQEGIISLVFPCRCLISSPKYSHRCVLDNFAGVEKSYRWYDFKTRGAKKSGKAASVMGKTISYYPGVRGTQGIVLCLNLNKKDHVIFTSSNHKTKFQLQNDNQVRIVIVSMIYWLRVIFWLTRSRLECSSFVLFQVYVDRKRLTIVLAP